MQGVIKKEVNKMYVASEYKTQNHYLTVKKFDEYQNIREAVKRVKEEAKKMLD